MNGDEGCERSRTVRSLMQGHERKRTERNEDEWNAKFCKGTVTVTRQKIK